jgi:cytochrome c-type biogenesis protein CcmE
MSDEQIPAARGRRRAIVLAAAVAAGAAILLVTAGGIGENLVYYWDATELHASGDRAIGATIRLGGMVAADSVTYSGSGSTLEFDVTDGERSVHVRSTGVPPQMFREGIGVVVEGTMTRAGTFEGHRLMISHDNEYRTPAEGEEIDIRERMRSVRGLDAS